MAAAYVFLCVWASVEDCTVPVSMEPCCYGILTNNSMALLRFYCVSIECFRRYDYDFSIHYSNYFQASFVHCPKFEQFRSIFDSIRFVSSIFILPIFSFDDSKWWCTRFVHCNILSIEHNQFIYEMRNLSSKLFWKGNKLKFNWKIFDSFHGGHRFIASTSQLAYSKSTQRNSIEYRSELIKEFLNILFNKVDGLTMDTAKRITKTEISLK